MNRWKANCHPLSMVRQLTGPFWIMLILYGCGQRSAKTDSTTQAAQPDTMCFRQVAGRDSTTLQLVIQDSTVRGELNVLPFEKDQARGSIRGTLSNNQIRADWQRSGEGVTQLYEVVFTLKGDAVTWREGERTEKQGKWVLKNPEQGYEYVLLKTGCR